MSDQNNIEIFGSNGQHNRENIPEAKLMAYLEGNLSPEEQHEVEEWLSTEGLESDAVEGLQSLSIEDTKQLTGRINQQLQTSLTTKRTRRRKLPDQKWSLLAVVVILLLAILAFAVIFIAQKMH